MTAPEDQNGLREALARAEAERDAARRERLPHMCRDDHPEIRHAVSDDDERCPVCRERDRALAAEDERDALLQAAGFRPGSFRSESARSVILGDIAGMRLAMVKARRAAERVQSDADLWTMRMLEEWPGDTLLLRLWR